MIKLSPRLQQIATMIKPCKHLIDVGCDHGYLSVFLVLNHLVDHVLNVDVNPEPLASASRHAHQYQVQDKIECKLNDGLKHLELDFHPNYITISGMGGYLISKILEQSSVTPDYYLLQPNNNVEKLRVWLFDHGYQIIQERVVFDNHIGYVILQAQPESHPITYDDADIYLGPCLKHQHHQPEVIQYFQFKYHQLSKIPSQFMTPDKTISFNLIKEFLDDQD